LIKRPRGAKKSDFDTLQHLASIVFRETLVQEYPQLFNEDNLENCRVILDDGKVVSHVGMTEQGASIMGCQVSVACIGGVGTLKEYRNRGFATRLFADACEKALRDGMDIMIVSGDRGIYRRGGCRRVGNDFDVTVKREHLSSFDAAEFALQLCTKADIPEISAIYRLESVRFHRRREDYERAFDGMVMNRYSDFLMVKKVGSTRGYVIIQRPGKQGDSVRLAEYAGERASIVAILGQLIRRYELGGLHVHVSGCDNVMKDLLEEKGFKLSVSHSSGTVRIVNFVQLMNRMRPYFEEILGYKKAGLLRFSEGEGAFKIMYAEQTVSIPDRGALAHFLFGTQEEVSGDWLANAGEIAGVLREVLPIQAFWYGINYI